MNNMKTVKRSLILSVLSLVLCFAMLLGTTFAWFTDSVASANNVIKSGNLDIELEYWNGEEWVDVAGKSDILTNTLWEPGVTEVAYLRIANAGSLALKYQLGINIVSETAGVNVAGETLKLSDYIQFGVVEGVNGKTGAYANREAAVAAVTSAKKISAGYTKAAAMTAGQELYLALVVYMPTTVGNEANYKTSDEPTNPDKYRPEINLGINVVATQMKSEEDSFGFDYDDGAFIPVAPEAIPDTAADIVLNGSAESKTTVKVPAAVAEALKDAGVTDLAVEASAPVADTENKTVNFSTVELVDQNGREVDLSNASAKVTVKLFVGDAFAKDDKVAVYHDGEFVTFAIVDADGYISYEVSHFCEVTVSDPENAVDANGEKLNLSVEPTDKVLVIDNVMQFMAFAEAVNAGKTYKGMTVTLGANLDLAGVSWTPIGTSANSFKGTFDGNGKVIKNLSVLMAGKGNVGLFGYTTEGEIKNVTVENAKIVGRTCVGVIAGTPYTTKYTNVIVKGHVEVDGLAYVGAVGGKNAYANWNNITVNVDAKSYVNAISVENGKAYRTYVGGVVGFNGEGGHSFTNITSNINVFGSTCDVGGAFGIAHYGNKFENVTVTGQVTCTAETAEIGGIAGVWSNDGSDVIFTNCKYEGSSKLAITGAAYSNSGNGLLIIDGVKYVASAAAFEAQLINGATVNLGGNITVADNKTLTIANGTTVTINLNGFQISGTASKTGNQELFLVKGNLTVKNGSLDYVASNNQGWGAMITIFDVTAGGVLNLDAVKASVAGSDMNFIAHLNNWGSATLNANNCDFTASYTAVRVFNSGYDMNNVTIKNTAVHGGRFLWVHNYINDGASDATLNLDFYGNGNTSDNAKPVRMGFSNAAYYDMNGTQIVTATTLTEVMAYAKKGNIIIDAQGANLGDFSYDGTFGNGTVLKNAKFTYVYGASVDGVATFENCEFVSDHSYSANFSDGKYTGKVVFNNCLFDGWSSFGTAITNVEMNNCTFQWNNPYSVLRFYQNAQLTGCNFVAIEGIDNGEVSGTTITLDNCTGIEGKIYNNTVKGTVMVSTWIVDGVTLTDVTAW